jgi:histidinol-phosphatase (PHP family)
MFDYHMHSTVSFDAKSTALEMALSARNAGLKEICFTDHIDYEVGVDKQIMVFDTDVYNAAYDHLEVPGLKIRRGMEFGLKPYNQAQLKQDLQRRHFDFVLGSIHHVDELDIYLEPYWSDKTVDQAVERYLLETLACVKVHDDYDVLGHLTYISKVAAHPDPKPVYYEEYREIFDEILRILARKGKGMEINSSGVDRCGDFLPMKQFFVRFKELGGEIVTIGSDAHDTTRVGQYADRACEILKDVFGYVCTFEDRKPIFHKL